MSLQAGTLVEGRYEIVRVVKAGGFGAVYEGRDHHLNCVPCAVKEMVQPSADCPESDLIRRRFREEMRFLTLLEHPNIPKIRDFFVSQGQFYIVMDFIHGQNLEDELSDYLSLTGAPTPPDGLARDVLVILDVLTYLHGFTPPVIYRDLKPANIVRAYESGQIKVVDFGMARELPPAVCSQTLIGTLAYCPVEQMQGYAETRSD
ncbi:MAG: protein kinase, partial [Armatimonadetes bacterium]|nr:protein kinase [Armatimonadota bacterium]